MTRGERRVIRRKLWAGFCDNEIDLDFMASHDKFYGVIYTTKSEALLSYDDVRPIEINLVAAHARTQQRRKR